MSVKAVILVDHMENEMRERRYASDLTDTQWSIIRPFIPAPNPGGRPRETNERDVLDAFLYLVRTGCQWRRLPSDFPHWQTVSTYFYAWVRGGTMREIQRFLSVEVRIFEGRAPAPTAICIDTQSVKSAERVVSDGVDAVPPDTLMPG